ncbi:MAG: phosphatidylserine decarboxylase [Acidobacteria bacterium]|nr:phosphatidylserine decarboxylase [Acidobacteriota bacterium]
MVITGIYYALALVTGGVVVSWLTKPALGAPFFVLALFCLWFFRDPERTPPPGAVAVSPADGKVLVVKDEGATRRISIFLNVFDVHVNRSPIAGKITKVEYHTGKFLVASREEASKDNEMNTITVEGGGSRVVFSQIAGLIARRIVCYKQPGDNVQLGERVGLIKFGSRVDIHLGPEWSIEVAPGQRVEAGTTVLARRKGV